jgi:hypothetical protein
MQWKRQITLNMGVCIILEYGLNIQMYILLKNLQYTYFCIKYVPLRKGMVQEV